MDNDQGMFIWAIKKNTDHSRGLLITRARWFHSGILRNLMSLSEARNSFSAKEVKRLAEEESLKLIPGYI